MVSWRSQRITPRFRSAIIRKGTTAGHAGVRPDWYPKLPGSRRRYGLASLRRSCGPVQETQKAIENRHRHPLIERTRAANPGWEMARPVETVLAHNPILIGPLGKINHRGEERAVRIDYIRTEYQSCKGMTIPCSGILLLPRGTIAGRFADELRATSTSKTSF